MKINVEQKKSDIGFKNMNPKLSYKESHVGYKAAGAGKNKTESVKSDPAEKPHQNTLAMKTKASAHPLGYGKPGSTEVKKGGHKFSKLVKKVHAGAHLDAGQTKPTWNTRKGRKAKRYA